MRRPLLLMAALLAGCASPETPVAHWPGGLVTQPGLYVHPRTGQRLQVKIGGGLVRYSVQDSIGQELLHNREQADATQPWALYAAPDGTLWVASRSVGNIVWRRSAEGTYYQRDATGDEPDRPAALTRFFR